MHIYFLFYNEIFLKYRNWKTHGSMKATDIQKVIKFGKCSLETRINHRSPDI